MGKHSSTISSLNRTLQTQFKFKELGHIFLFFGIQVLCISTRHLLHQQHYLKDILNHYGMQDFKFSSTPISLWPSASFDSHLPFSQPHLFHQTVGSL